VLSLVGLGLPLRSQERGGGERVPRQSWGPPGRRDVGSPGRRDARGFLAGTRRRIYEPEPVNANVSIGSDWSHITLTSPPDAWY
jgi:hypothetical protein